MKFNLVMADPAWPEKGGGKIKRGADRHYKLMSCKEIRELGVQLKPVLDDDSYLLLWATSNYLKQAFDVVDAWGFRYVTDFVWVKQGSAGLGQYRRSRHEHLLLGVRGRPPMPAKAWRDSVIDWPEDVTELPSRLVGFPDSVIEAPRAGHSVKPEAAFAIADNLLPAASRLELFARTVRPGWECLGDELDGCPLAQSLSELHQ